jgi:hypothetical protein
MIGVYLVLWNILPYAEIFWIIRTRLKHNQSMSGQITFPVWYTLTKACLMVRLLSVSDIRKCLHRHLEVTMWYFEYPMGDQNRMSCLRHGILLPQGCLLKSTMFPWRCFRHADILTLSASLNTDLLCTYITFGEKLFVTFSRQILWPWKHKKKYL